MASIDPRAIALRNATAPRYELKLHDISPEQIIPNGDRYVVEVIDIDEKVELGQILVLAVQPDIDPRDPKADPKVERRGVIAAVVVTVGNGHLLGIPDWPDYTTVTQERMPANVPMFYNPGDVVFVDNNAKGRALRIIGREVRIVNQIDVLSKIEGLRLVRGDNGWEKE